VDRVNRGYRCLLFRDVRDGEAADRLSDALPRGSLPHAGKGGCIGSIKVVPPAGHSTKVAISQERTAACNNPKQCPPISPRRNQAPLLHFLKKIDREVPKGLAVHVITDNYATRGHDNVQARLARHPRFHFHFTPTSSSWLNLVERRFRELTQKAIRRGVFRSVPDLVAAIYDYLEAHNADPKPFIWTASAEEILEKVKRGRVALGRVAS
jgi:transposase